MTPKEEEIAGRLLRGRPGLSRSDKEAVLERVLAGLPDDAPRSSSRFGWFAVLGACAAAAMVLLVVRPSPDVVRDDGFGVRGREGGPQLRVVCASTMEASRCSAGDEVLLELAAVESWTHVAAYAERSDGTRLWYVPGPDDRSVPIERGTAMSLVPRKIRLGPEHPPGTYEVVVVLSRRPLTRAEIETGGESRDVAVVRRVLTVS